MPADFVPTAAELRRFLPEILLAAVATLIMVLTPFAGGRARGVLERLALLGLAGALLAAVAAHSTPGFAFRRAYVRISSSAMILMRFLARLRSFCQAVPPSVVMFGTAPSPPE